jgi:hypothetical protein
MEWKFRLELHHAYTKNPSNPDVQSRYPDMTKILAPVFQNVSLWSGLMGAAGG